MRKFLIKILQSFISSLARWTVNKFKPLVIAITGSVGKTSAKEAIYCVLKNRRRTRRASANFNNELGVPLTILGSWNDIRKPAILFWLWVILASLFRLVLGRKKSFPEIIILEYGADKPGDISYLLKIAKPNIAVISGLGKIPVHVENYPVGIEGVFKEKSKLVSDLSVSNFAVINNDDPMADKIKEKTRARVLTYGFSKGSDIRISNFSHTTFNNNIVGATFKLDESGSSIPVVVDGAFSISHAYASACAACVGKVLNINPIDVAQSISSDYYPTKGRSAVLKGIKNTQIIDESYNSSPLALETALKTLSKITNRRKIAVLGDMMELGDFSIKAHEDIGKIIPESVDVLITVGPRAKFFSEKALKKGMSQDNVFSFDDPLSAGLKLQDILNSNDLVLIKGSRSVGLDKIVEEVAEM